MCSSNQLICTINPHKFISKGFIKSHFLAGLSEKEQQYGVHGSIPSSITQALSTRFFFKPDTVNTLHLDEHQDQEMFQWVLKRYSGSLKFLLENKLLYKYSDLISMFANGEFQQITEGTASQVTFSEYQHCS